MSNRAYSLFQFETEAFSGKRKKARVGLLHRKTSVPAFLIFLRGIEKSYSVPLSSINDLDSIQKQDISSENSMAWALVRSFFEAGGTRAYLCASPLDPNQTASVLDQMIGQDQSYISKTGIYTLKNAVDRADLVVVPQAPLLLPSLEYQTFCSFLCRWISIQRNFFLILDFPKAISYEDAPRWLTTLQCDDAGIYYPWLFQNGKILPSSPFVAAAFQVSDQEIGFHENPTNRPIQTTAVPLIKLTVHQSTQLQLKRINSLLSFRDIPNIVWGAQTLASSPLSEYRLIATRRIIKHLSDAITGICDHYVLEPLNRSTLQILQNELDDFCSTHKYLFNDRSIRPYQVTVSATETADEMGILVDCNFHLNSSIESVHLSIGVSL
jgi:hypothetical protein